MNVFIYCNLIIICIIINVTINMTTVSSLKVSVIAQWIGHSPLVHEVVRSPLVGGRMCFGVLEYVSHKTCVVISNTSTCVKSTQACVFHI